jgi:hypothetical protein
MYLDIDDLLSLATYFYKRRFSFNPNPEYYKSSGSIFLLGKPVNWHNGPTGITGQPKKAANP